METLKKAFGRRFRALREARGFSREYVSQYVEIDPQSIYRLEKGDQWIAPEKLENACRFFNVSPAVFFTDDVVRIQPTPEDAIEILRRAIEAPKEPPTEIPADIARALSDPGPGQLETVRAALGLRAPTAQKEARSPAKAK